MSFLRELATLLRLPWFRRLFATRVTSQLGDGVLQMGFATILFFSPERAATAGGIALAYAVMLAPFTLIGPWVGVLLDLWRRRQVLVVANTIRALLAVGVAVTLWLHGPDAVLYVGVLLILTINRFLLSAFSASQPRTVPGELLLTANALSPTLGTGAAFLGSGLAALAGVLIPAGAARDGAFVAAAAVIFAMAAIVASRFAKNDLGPDDRSTLRAALRDLRAFSRGLAEGAHHLIDRRTPALALAVIGLHRLLFGIMFVAALLISRNLLATDGSAAPGLGIFALALAATAVGGGTGAVLTPILRHRVAEHRWVVISLAIGALSQVPLLIAVSVPTLLAQAALAGFASQALKITVDTIVQRDTDDAVRGRAFALYDVVYNAMFVAAAAVAVVLLPDSGYSVGAYALVGLAFVAIAAWFGFAYARIAPRVPVTNYVGAPRAHDA